MLLAVFKPHLFSERGFKQLYLKCHIWTFWCDWILFHLITTSNFAQAHQPETKIKKLSKTRINWTSTYCCHNKKKKSERRNNLVKDNCSQNTPNINTWQTTQVLNSAENGGEERIRWSSRLLAFTGFSILAKTCPFSNLKLEQGLWLLNSDPL